MSLLWRRRDIARAVAGDLAPAPEDRLRAHLRRCAACRAFYDQLVDAAGAISASGGGASQRAGEGERERLARALPGPEGTPPRPVPARPRRWLLAGLVLAPAAAVALWLKPGSPPPPAPTPAPPEIAFRGGPPADASADGPTLVVYASRRASGGGRAPVRLVGEFPGSGTIRVASSDYLQFGVRRLANPALLSVVASQVGPGGSVHVFLPRAGAPPPLAPAGSGSATVGPSFDLSRAPTTGRYTLTARFAPAAGDAAMDAAPVEVSGLLIIEP